jgi:protein gp37
MGEATAIGWCDHSFNPWWGCTRVSPACNNCYAEAFAKRTGNAVWGKNAERRFFGEKHWDEPLRWAAKAERDGVRRRVFCASMADVFEDRRDLDDDRARLWDLIGATGPLDWLLLTKRPENVERLVPAWWDGCGWPANVWLGATVEDQRRAEERIPALIACPARVRFLSCEPLLEPIDLSSWLDDLHWVIVGGESGPGARRLDPANIVMIVTDCRRAGVPVFMKQAGKLLGKEWGCPDTHGARWESWPAWARRREFPIPAEVSP